MSAEENLALVRRFMEARIVKRDLAAVAEMLAPDFIYATMLRIPRLDFLELPKGE